MGARSRREWFLVAALAGLCFSCASAGAATGPARPLLLAEGVELDTASWSADGQRLVIDRRSPTGLFVVERTGGGVQRLTEGGYHNQPVWSPQSNDVAYVDKGLGGLWIIEYARRDASARQVLEGAIEIYDRAWSPDGTKIVFHFLQQQSLAIVDVRTGDTRTLVEKIDREWVTSPRWSPSGDALVGSRRTEVVRVSLASGKTETIRGVQGRHPRWGKDGTIWLAAARAPQVLLRRAEDGGVQDINLSGRIGSLDADSVSGRAAVSVDGRGIAIVSADGQEVEWVLEDPAAGSVSIAPGGCAVSFVRKDRKEGTQLFVLELRSTRLGDVTCG